MSKFFHGLHNLANDIVAFMLCLALFFGIASEASAVCTPDPPRPSFPRCDWPCSFSASISACKLRGTLGSLLGLPGSLLGDDEDPTDTLNSPNSDPLPPSSGAVAPPIGNPAP